jgi:ribA/ribD-fused uncharacterized protein
MQQESESKIDKFDGEYAWLSNFYPVVIHYSGLNFPTVEHAYQASKTENYAMHRKIVALPAERAGKAKRIGRTVKLRKDWEMLKISLMRRFLYQKFGYSELQLKLIDTECAYIEEGNYWHDNYWGNCYCDKCKNIEGKNQLGKLIMKIRGNIQ